MSSSTAQHTLREMRLFFARPMTRILLAAGVVLLGLSGPFGTHDALGFGPRLAYWAITAPLTFAAGVFMSIYLPRKLKARPRPLPAWLIKALTAAGTALVVCPLVLAINWLAFERAPLGQDDLLELIASVVSVTIVISLVLLALPDKAPAQDGAVPALPPLLDRLDFDKRGALVSLSVQDHYVEVTTTNGTALVLMRLSDAIRETGTTEGVQVHRSHWVAKAQIASARRQGDKALLTMKDGREIPASRSNIAKLKEAGILPR